MSCTSVSFESLVCPLITSFAYQFSEFLVYFPMNIFFYTCLNVLVDHVMKFLANIITWQLKNMKSFSSIGTYCSYSFGIILFWCIGTFTLQPLLGGTSKSIIPDLALSFGPLLFFNVHTLIYFYFIRFSGCEPLHF